jgi:preprotein translocase subunit SecA
VNRQLVEMATGEGKTLVALLPAYLFSLTGKSSFVVTSNDYLARRDGEIMGQVLKFLGVSVGIVQTEQNEQEKRASYNCDVTYVSNQALGFDYLRDNLAISKDSLLIDRPFGFCLVDEADSILIDEARTPLIISRKSPSASSKYFDSAKIAKNMAKNDHYEIDEKLQKVSITSTGFEFIEKLIGKSPFDISDPWAYYILNALRAKELLTRDRQYIVDQGEVSIIDDFSGRVLSGRKFTDGLQQAIEAKEGLVISPPTQCSAKVSYQSLFRLFPNLSGMTGTAATDAEEFKTVYNLTVSKIPTALPVARRDYPDAVFRTKTGKMKTLLKNIMTVHQKGRPILIGTTSIESSEEIYRALLDLGKSHLYDF